MNKIILTMIAAMLLVFVPACKKKQVAPIRTALTVETNPSGATVKVLGKERGVTPYNCRLKPGTYNIKLTKNGYFPEWVPVTVQGEKQKKITVDLKGITADVLLESNPQGAVIVFNKKKMGITPLVLRSLKVGNYSVSLQVPGYAERTVSWNIDSPRPKLVSAELSSNIGALKIESIPAKAEVLINGKRVGISPLKRKLSQGSYNIQLLYPGYEPLSATVAVRKNHEEIVSYQLQPLPASLNITSNPIGASVEIDGKNYGKTPLNLAKLESRAYKITVSMKGYDSAMRSVNLAPGKTVPLHFDLVANLGSLEFVTVPAGVTVYLDGKLIGITKEEHSKRGMSEVFRIKELKPGTYRLKFVHKRAQPSEKIMKVNVGKGKNIRLHRNVEMWIANAIVTMSDGTKCVGRLKTKLKNGGIIFEHSPGISYECTKDQFTKIEMIDMKE